METRFLPPKWAFGILWGSYYDQIGSTFAQNGNILTAATQLRAQYSGDLMWIDSSWLWHNYSGDPVGTPNYINFQFDPTGGLDFLKLDLRDPLVFMVGADKRVSILARVA